MLGPFFEPPVTEKNNAARRIVGERRCVSNRACERCHSTALKAAGLYDRKFVVKTPGLRCAVDRGSALLAANAVSGSSHP
jgi:hypothetical protein